VSFSGMVFLVLLGLIILGPKKLPRVGNQIGEVLADLESFTHEFKSQLEIEMEGAIKEEDVAPASSPQSKLPAETDARVPESDAFESEPRRIEAFHG
jgi:sec-independent protein translocase protein TatB